MPLQNPIVKPCSISVCSDNPTELVSFLACMDSKQREDYNKSLLSANIPEDTISKTLLVTSARKLAPILKDRTLKEEEGGKNEIWIDNSKMGFKPNTLVYGDAGVYLDADPRRENEVEEKKESCRKKWDNVPAPYRPIKIERTTHWKKGKETDMANHNHTSQAGLGNDHRDHYVNAGLQILFHMVPIRAAVLSHICDAPNCLTCELSFLFHMMQQARAAPLAVRCAEPSNFLRCLRLLPEATALGLRFPSKLRANVRV